MELKKSSNKLEKLHSQNSTLRYTPQNRGLSKDAYEHIWSGNMKAQNALIQVSFIKMETGKITRVSNVEREGMREIRVQRARLSPRFALS